MARTGLLLCVGGIHGIFQIIEKALGWNKKDSKGLIKALRIVFTFAIVTIAWVIFRSPSIGDAVGLIGQYFSTNGKFIADLQTLLHIVIAITPLLLYEFGKGFFPMAYEKVRRFTLIRWAVYLAVFAKIVLIGVHDGSLFIYVSF